MDSRRTSPSATEMDCWLDRIRSRFLIPYFSSGWAFLVPYLAVYLLYAALDWPVNPDDQPPLWEPVIASMPSETDGVPLLHVYWLLHAVHAMLTAMALHAWLRHTLSASPVQARNVSARHCVRHGEETATGWSRMAGLVPWVCLALLFWIPGVYLEWPADPWSHFERVNLWRSADTVATHPTWMKSSYFLGYSLIGRITDPATQLTAYNLFYVACCMLLCWQYRLLGRDAGLGARATLIFVVVQLLTMGNNLFDFYRYYGMSSSLFVQLGAIALIRAALSACRASSGARNGGWIGRGALLLGTLVTVGALIAFNHPQGLGIAALGVASVIAWRLVAWRRSSLYWLGAGIAVASLATILWLPRHPQLDANLKPAGWFNAWYGLNLLWPGTPAFERSFAIWGAFGVLNLVASAWLICRNHLAGWLTLFPVLLLSLPVVSVPLANLLLSSGQEILVYHRMLLVIPSGLALVTLLSEWVTRHAGSNRAYAVLILALAAVVVVPAGRPGYNRAFNLLATVPDDLTGLEIPRTGALPRPGPVSFQPGRWPAPLLAPDDVLFRLHALGYPTLGRPQREVWMHPPAAQTERVGRMLIEPEHHALLALGDPSALHTPFSQTGYLSGHWLGQHVAAGMVGTPELARTAMRSGLTEQPWQRLKLYHPASFEVSRPYGAYKDLLLDSGGDQRPTRLALNLDPRMELLVEVTGRAVSGSVEPSLEPDPAEPALGQIKNVSRDPWVWAVHGHRTVHVQLTSTKPFSWRLQGIRVLAPGAMNLNPVRPPATP